MRTAKSHNILIVMNTSTSSEYVKKKKSAEYMQHQITMTVCVAFKTYLQDTDASTATKITHHELQNATKKRTCEEDLTNIHLVFQMIQNQQLQAVCINEKLKKEKAIQTEEY